MGGVLNSLLTLINNKIKVQNFNCIKLDDRVRTIEGYRIGNYGYIVVGTGTMNKPLEDTSTPFLKLPFKKVTSNYQLIYSSGSFANLSPDGTLRIRPHMNKPVMELAFTMSFIILEE